MSPTSQKWRAPNIQNTFFLEGILFRIHVVTLDQYLLALFS